MATVPCNRCAFQECEVVRVRKKLVESYVLIAKCFGCGKCRVLSESEYATLYEKIDEIPIDDKPDTMEQRAADRQKYFNTHSVGKQGAGGASTSKNLKSNSKMPVNRNVAHVESGHPKQHTDWNETWSERNSGFINEFANLLLRRKSSGKGRIVVFAGAAISIRPPSCLPLANVMLKETIKLLLEDEVLAASLRKGGVINKLNEHIRESTFPEDQTKRLVPPEMIYDAIYEFAGKKVFRALDCLESDRPNPNHKILARLLDQGYIDNIITTNFDCLIEQCLPKRFPLLHSAVRDRVWHIHGSIDAPSSIATTLHRIGRAAFDEKLLKRLTTVLDASHVLFIGYSGADPDLMPAFMKAKMASVFWCILKPKEIDNNAAKDPWKAIQAKTAIRWIVGDLYEELFGKIALRLGIQSEEKIPACKDTESPLDECTKKWEQNETERLSPDEKARIILQILYDTALYSSESKSAETWELLIVTARALAEDPALSNYWYSEFRRDLHVFQAEANLYLANLAAGDKNRTRDFLVRAKDHLTTVLPLHKKDAVQVQALLDMGALVSEENPRAAEAMFKEGLEICNQAQMASGKGRLLKARCYANLAGLCLDENKLECLNLLDRAEKLFKESGDLYSYVGTCMNISRLYIEIGKIAEAKSYCDKAKDILRTFPNQFLEDELAAFGKC